MKRCIVCNEVKILVEFGIKKTCTDGRLNQCKVCIAKKALAVRRTKKGLVKRIYHGQKKNSIHRGHPMPTYTIDELRLWFKCNPVSDQLFLEWRASGYEKMLAPSVDRIDDYKGYSLDNIQLLTWQDNLDKSHIDRKEGRNNKHNKAVIQLTLDSEFMEEFHSAAEADRQTSIDRVSIGRCCVNKSQTAGGFKWKYKTI